MQRYVQTAAGILFGDRKIHWLGFCIVLLSFACSYGLAQTAMLECTADTTLGGADRAQARRISWPLFLNFRFGPVAGWRAGKARLLLHRASGPLPAKIGVALIGKPWTENDPPAPVKPSRFLAAKDIGDGWMEVTLDAALLQPVLDGRAHGFLLSAPDGAPRQIDTRETIQYCPYLILEAAIPPSSR